MLMFLCLYPVARVLPLLLFPSFRSVLSIVAKLWERWGRVFLVFMAPWRTVDHARMLVT